MAVSSGLLGVGLLKDGQQPRKYAHQNLLAKRHDMTTKLKIDFVSDVSCPWCVVGLKALDQALARINGDMKDHIQVELRFQPFELNPQMPADGQDITEHITEKYGITPAQAEANRENIRQRGAELGFTFSGNNAAGGGRSRIYNTFDAHRLLHWAELESLDQQKALKEALFAAYFTDGQSPGSHALLVTLAGQVGLNTKRAQKILASDEFADAVRAREAFYTKRGIRSVPAVIINDQHLISGGQPVEVFEQALRQIAQAL